MKLGLAMLDNVPTLNNLKYINQLSVTQGESVDLYFQLIDRDTKDQKNQWGNRYMPASGATLQVIIKSVNDANTLTKSASMAFPSDDRSIWKVTLSTTETANMAGINLQATLTEGANVKIAFEKNVLSVDTQNPYQC